MRGGSSRLTSTRGRALIIAQCAIFPVSVCRSLARRGVEVHVFAEELSSVFRSRHCHRGFSSPLWTEGPAFLANLDRVVDAGAYDAIYVASEPILHFLARRPRTGPWLALPLPPPATLDVFLSKHRIVRRVAESEAPVPRTIVPETDRDLEEAGRELGFPILVKGEHGTASAHVRLCRDRAALWATYAAMVARERRLGGRPALQEYVAGPKYTLSGLFRDGVALRIVGYRALLTCPPEAGETVKLVTEAPPGFRETALGAFEALGHTGIGSAEFWSTRGTDGSSSSISPRDSGATSALRSSRAWIYSGPMKRSLEAIPFDPTCATRPVWCTAAPAASLAASRCGRRTSPCSSGIVWTGGSGRTSPGAIRGRTCRPCHG